MMPDADVDEEEWKEVAKNGKGKTKEQREETAEKKKANKEAKKAVKVALKVAQAAAAAVDKEALNDSNKGKTSTPRAGTTGPTHKKDSQYHTCFILNVGGKDGG